MNLLIVSAMPHYIDANQQIVGWGPTVEEITHLASLFDHITHIGVLYPCSPPNSSLPYGKPNIHFIPVRPSGGNTLTQKFDVIRKAPEYIRKVIAQTDHADIVHVRAPANISMLAILILTFQTRPRARWVKYAGNWRPGYPEPWSYTLQRRWLERGLHRGVVTINGRWDNQPGHVYSFYNPCLTWPEIHQGKLAAENKDLAFPLRFLFVGAIHTSKGIGKALEIVKTLKDENIPCEFDIVGDGPMRPEFEGWASMHGITADVRFHGWQPKPALPEFYSQAHFILLPSNSEGWPKVLSEAMAYGVVPLAGAVSSIPQILGETGAGMALPHDDIEAYIKAICSYVENPQTWRASSQAGVRAAQRFTYDYYLDSVRDMFKNAWDITLPAVDQTHGNISKFV